jgi:hypothetical protein
VLTGASPSDAAAMSARARPNWQSVRARQRRAVVCMAGDDAGAGWKAARSADPTKSVRRFDRHGQPFQGQALRRGSTSPDHVTAGGEQRRWMAR